MELKQCERPLKVAICEDNEDDTTRLILFIKNSSISCMYDTFNNAEDLISSFEPNKYDLIFLDIYMSEITGIDAAAKIRDIDNFVSIAFTTASLEHTLESYRLGAIKYLEKPLSSKEVEETLKITLRLRNINYLSVLSEGKTVDILLSSILYFELNNRHVTVATTAGSIRISQTIKLADIGKMLPDNFFRCHHSYIVNFSYIRKLEKELNSFLMINGDYVHIRRQDKKQAMEAYEDYLFNMSRKAGISNNEQQSF